MIERTSSVEEKRNPREIVLIHTHHSYGVTRRKQGASVNGDFTSQAIIGFTDIIVMADAKTSTPSQQQQIGFSESAQLAVRLAHTEIRDAMNRTGELSETYNPLQTISAEFQRRKASEHGSGDTALGIVAYNRKTNLLREWSMGPTVWLANPQSRRLEPVTTPPLKIGRDILTPETAPEEYAALYRALTSAPTLEYAYTQLSNTFRPNRRKEMQDMMKKVWQQRHLAPMLHPDNVSLASVHSKTIEPGTVLIQATDGAFGMENMTAPTVRTLIAPHIKHSPVPLAACGQAILDGRDNMTHWNPATRANQDDATVVVMAL